MLVDNGCGSIGPFKSSVSGARGRLIELMQRLHFGRVEGLIFIAGHPVFDPPPRIVHEIKFGGKNGPHPKAGSGDFALKAQVRDLFARLEELGDGVILCLEIKHGLPFKMDVEGGAAE